MFCKEDVKTKKLGIFPVSQIIFKDEWVIIQTTILFGVFAWSMGSALMVDWNKILKI